MKRLLPLILAWVALTGFAGAVDGQDTVGVADSIAGDSVAAGDSVPAPPDSIAESDVEPVPFSQEEEDERIRSMLQAVFDRVPSLQGIDATVSAGVVQLAGHVPDSEAEARAIALAEGLAGVVYVDGRGLAPEATGARLESVWSRLRDKTGDFLLLLPLLAVAAVIVAFFSLAAWAAGRRSAVRLIPAMNPFLGSLLQRLLQFGLVVTGLVIALDLLDATALVGAVVGTAGLAGLALGFAFKDIAENYLAGVILSLRNPFAKNDWIKVGDHEGKVVRLTGRETILMTLDGNHVQLPNAIVFREPMVNYTRNPLRRFNVEIGVAGDTELSTALDAGLAVLRRMDGVTDQPPPNGLVWGFGASTITLRFLAWVDQKNADWFRVRSEANRLVKLGLEEAGVVLPIPEQIVHLPDRAAVPPVARTPTGAPPSPGPPSPPPSTAAPAQRDISVDLTLDAQIEQERRATGDEDLLVPESGETESGDASPEGG